MASAGSGGRTPAAFDRNPVEHNAERAWIGALRVVVHWQVHRRLELEALLTQVTGRGRDSERIDAPRGGRP